MQNIRNFVIISHVDHGKSTLADRFLELTNTVPQGKMRPQYLDMMDLEREKGITIKMQPCRMNYVFEGKPYILNLIDTPGHADFSYEVSRALAAVEGAILLVDATKGVQAQTIYNLELAKKQNLVIVTAVNKIDSAQAKTEETKEEITKIFGIKKEEILEISARQGMNCEQLLGEMIKKVPAPTDNTEKPFRALIFDSRYDSFKGVVAYVRVVDGVIKSGEKIYLTQTKAEGEIKELGYFTPEFSSQKELRSGEVGYIATGIKEIGKVRVGDTITNLKSETESLPGYKESNPMVFASLYPEDPDDFDILKEALGKLKLNDAALTFEPEMKEALGRGFLCGFLGSLHAEITTERIKREFNLGLVISRPSVVYQIVTKNDKRITIYSTPDWPDQNDIKEIQEPWVKMEVITPQNYLGRVMEILGNLNGNFIQSEYFGSEKTILIYEAPLREVICVFYENLKGATQGFASMSYEILGYRAGDLVKLEILVAGEREEAFSKIVGQKEAVEEGRRMVERLKDLVPPQMYSVPIQAAVSGKIIARETIKARRRDVIAPLYGGDYTRKRKLLEKQKKGKKELKEKGEIHIPPKVFLEMFKS